ncbi:MAG: CheW-like domain-containing protein [Candidatus Electronema aureum]|uniref:CheW-like domain-containing protein n=1 Tax=Candidatus Electronema aureum TaxID=2005002 RepID=A0A521G3T6_9BACT|nr:MAG: CheW-like domain-containing protein [Candidatus Electronema aureum]
MPDEQGIKRAALKTVAVRLTGAKVLDQEPVLLFATRQVEEILQDVEVRPLPFAPDWLLGLCAWRRQVLPVVDIAKLHGMSFSADRSLYMVIRLVVPAEDEKENSSRRMLRCILKVSDRIAARELPKQCAAAAIEASGLDPALFKGLFAHEDGMMMVPNLLPTLCPPAAWPEPAV